MSNIIETAIVIANFGIYDIAFAKGDLAIKTISKEVFQLLVLLVLQRQS